MSIITNKYLNSFEDNGQIYTLCKNSIVQTSKTKSSIICRSETSGDTFTCDKAGTILYTRIGDNILHIYLNGIVISSGDSYPSSGKCILCLPKVKGYFIKSIYNSSSYTASISDLGKYATVTITGDWSGGDPLTFNSITLVYITE